MKGLRYELLQRLFHTLDIPSIDDKIISMYAKGMTARRISETIDVYGFDVSESTISNITDKLLRNWQQDRGELMIMYPDRMPD